MPASVTGVDVVDRVTGELLESHPKLEKCNPYKEKVIAARSEKRANKEVIPSATEPSEDVS